jgi:hypothetical protein
MYLYVLLFVEGKISDKKMQSESNNATYKKRKFGTLGVLAFFELFPAVPYT